jgi:flagellar biogenesis protein FliO
MSKKVLPRITNLPGKEIRILETAHLGPRKAVHLVKIGNQRLLIGSTYESISMLADVTEQDEPDLVNLRGEQIDACVRE